MYSLRIKTMNDKMAAKTIPSMYRNVPIFDRFSILTYTNMLKMTVTNHVVNLIISSKIFPRT